MPLFTMKKETIGQNLHHKNTLNVNEFRELMAERSKASNSKYNNTWVLVDGIKFQSIAEADYYGKLKMRLLAKDIKGFRRQVKFEFVFKGVWICTYTADFVIDELNGNQTVVDVKSEATEKIYTFQLKKNLMKAFYNIDVKTAK